MEIIDLPNLLVLLSNPQAEGDALHDENLVNPNVHIKTCSKLKQEYLVARDIFQLEL